MTKNSMNECECCLLKIAKKSKTKQKLMLNYMKNNNKKGLNIYFGTSKKKAPTKK